MSYNRYPSPPSPNAVVGPGSSTDNAVARWDGTTGKLLQNSTVIVDDSGNMSGVGTLSTSSPLTVTIPSAGTKGIVVNAAGAQTANLQEWRDSSTDLLASIQSDGSAFFSKNGSPILLDGMTVPGFSGFWSASATLAPTATNFSFLSSGVSVTALNVASGGVTQLRAGGASALVVSDASAAFVPRVIIDYNNPSGTAGDANASLSVLPLNNTYKGVVIQGKASQSGNLQEWQNSSGTALTSIDASGNLGVGSAAPARRLEVKSADNLAATNFASFYSNNGAVGINIGYNSILHTNDAGNAFDIGLVGLPTAIRFSPSRIDYITNSSYRASFDSNGFVVGNAYAAGGATAPSGGGMLVQGAVGINNTSPGSQLQIKGTGSSSATSSLNITDSTSASKFFVRDDGNIGVGTSSPATSAAVEISSTTGALLLPRMTTTQRDALTAVNGMLIYNSTLNKFQGYENGAWTNLI